MNIPLISFGIMSILLLIPWIIFNRKWSLRVRQIYGAFYVLSVLLFVLIMVLIIKL